MGINLSVIYWSNHNAIFQEELQDARKKYNELQKLYEESESKINELKEAIDSSTTHENISISKLTADIASDKVAAQRATEQNKKLKTRMQELEEAFVKMVCMFRLQHVLNILLQNLNVHVLQCLINDQCSGAHIVECSQHNLLIHYFKKAWRLLTFLNS